MKKTLLYLVIVAILGAGVWFFFFYQKDSVLDAPKTADGVREDAFGIKDTAHIGKIFLAKRSGESSTLERGATGWKIDNRYPAAQYQVDRLLGTIAQQSAQTPVPENLRDAVVRYLAGDGIKVELYDLRGDKLRTFYVGGEAKDYAGTYMLMQGAQKAYVVQIPYFTGYLTPRYMPGTAIWRDRHILYAPEAEITRVSVDYTEVPEQSFVISRDAAGNATIEASAAATAGAAPEAGNIKSYLGSFEKLYVLNYINGNAGLDSVIAGMPLRCTLSLSTRENNNQRMLVYYYPLTRRSKNLDAPEGHHGVNNNYDADNFYAVLNGDKDTAVIQAQLFDKIFRRAADFYPAPAK